eukprot:TRINITY_DN1288_c0_g1_i1.p1 TRINITY_DN1288_c0_g1~~TRINITY_DN1288_c0_g1_i1.p1  ORF type:complete len:140 (-),score=32.36 TRINITY_DN1288_c0_g1_i1:5-424(-)
MNMHSDFVSSQPPEKQMRFVDPAWTKPRHRFASTLDKRPVLREDESMKYTLYQDEHAPPPTPSSTSKFLSYGTPTPATITSTNRNSSSNAQTFILQTVEDGCVKVPKLYIVAVILLFVILLYFLYVVSNIRVACDCYDV